MVATAGKRRTQRFAAKYKAVEGKFIIDPSRNAIRPIDFESTDDDHLREHGTLEAAVAFEEVCYKEAKLLRSQGHSWSQ